MRERMEARIPEQSAMDVLDRVLGELGDDIDRVTILALNRDGRAMRLYSNARSEAEMFGMMHVGLNFTEDVDA